MIREAIFGLAIGDALGVPFEFKERGTFECKKMEGYGTHNQEKGVWSDDTSMTIATVKSLVDNDWNINIKDMKKNFLLWKEKGEFAICNNVFDIGTTTAIALSSGEGLTDINSNGNGSLMRILPLAFTDCSDAEIEEVSAITHAHEISKEACVIFVHIARRLLLGETIREIIPTLKNKKPFDWLSYTDCFSEKQIRSTGYVVDTLEAVLWSLAHSSSFDESVLRAVNLGGDTDTIGAITGGLAGIIYPDEVFASRFYKDLKGKNLIFRYF